jgi:hypothetical protein
MWQGGEVEQIANGGGAGQSVEIGTDGGFWGVDNGTVGRFGGLDNGTDGRFRGVDNGTDGKIGAQSYPCWTGPFAVVCPLVPVKEFGN